MTEIWVVCPHCQKDTYPNWDTFAFAGNFAESVVCKHCGAEFRVSVNVSQLTPFAADLAECVCELSNLQNGVCTKCGLPWFPPSR